MPISLDIQTLVKTGISPDQYVYLYCIINNIPSEGRPKINFHPDFFTTLQDAGYIKMKGTQFVIRGPALDLFPAKDMKFDDFIREYRLIFKASGRIGIMGSKEDCIKKMKLFLKKNPEYSQERILDAARTYVDSQAENGYKYLQQADYFISKQDKQGATSSRLSAYLEEQEIETPHNMFTRNV